MSWLVTFIMNMVRTRLTAEVLKRLAVLLLEEGVKRTELKTDDATLEMYNAIESGDKERQSKAMSGLMDALELDAKEIFSSK